MKQKQQENYKAEEKAFQVVMPLDLGISIPEDDSVRTLIKTAERMNWEELNKAYERQRGPGEATPKQMFLLVILGFMHEKYSLRKIEEACRHDIRFMWILGGKKIPDHTRLSRFLKRIENGIMEDLFYQFIHLLREDEEVRYEHLFVDGTKIEANANRYTYVWRKRVTKELTKIQEKEKKLVNALRTKYPFELADTENAETVLKRLYEKAEQEKIEFKHGSHCRKTELQREIEALGKAVKKEQEYIKHIEIMGERGSYSKTDHSATFMKMKEDHMKNGQPKAGYNVQLGIEAEYIVGVNVSSNPNDMYEMLPLLERMETKGGIRHQDVTADAGYESEETYTKLEERGQEAYIKPSDHETRKGRRTESNLRNGMEYNQEKDCFVCRAGKELNFKRSKQTKTKTGYIKEMSVYETESCKGCPHREQCINKKEKEIKTIEISWKFTAQREASRARITSPKGIMLRINRSIQSEGAFGVLKEDRHFRRLKRRGKEGVFEEILLYAFSFNILKLHAKRQNNRLKSMLFYENTA